MRTITSRALVVSAALALALAGAGCSDDEDTGGTTSTTAPASTTAAPDDTMAGPDDTMADMEADDDMAVAGIAVLESTAGEIVVLDGLPVYAFDRDTPESSSCVDDCAAAWPAVPADAELDPTLTVTTGSITRADGTEQLTINGAPVYTFATDSALPVDGTGEPLGQGVGEVWWVVGADGNPMRTTASN